jgi:hypothetical protein
MPIRLSDTQKITNVPNARDIGRYVNLNSSQLPGANNPRPAYPTIQSGFSAQTETYELIDSVDFLMSNFQLSNIGFPYNPGRYKTHKLVFSKFLVDYPTMGLIFDDTQSSATYSYEYEQRAGSTATYASSWSTGQTQIILGNANGFDANRYGITGEIVIDSSRTSGPNSAPNDNTRPICYWNLAGGYNFRTYGHGTMDNSSPVSNLYLKISASPIAGFISYYGLPRN